MKRKGSVEPIVFLGGGNITNALIAGLRLARCKRRIVIYDRNVEKMLALRRKFHVETAKNLANAVSGAEVLIIAVRPGSVAELLDTLTFSGALSSSVLAISLAAGVPIKSLRTRLGTGVRWVRAMPSPVCRIGRGLTALSFDRNVLPIERKNVRELFAHVGAVVEISENCFDVFNATFSPGHGYHALDTLSRAAQNAGLDRKTALTAASHALANAVLYYRQSGQDLDELLHESATPGGTTAATIDAMNRAGYVKSVANGVAAGVKQARMNAKRFGK